MILREARNPKDIPWRENGVSLVVDCTGKFHDPHADADDPKGSLRGHLAAGARAVVQSSPFKSKLKGVPLPDDSAILIYGINHLDYDPGKHKLVSAASCTTTALAHMMRPLLVRDLTRSMITAGMSTVHAVTNSQPVLDAVPGSGRQRPAQDPGGHEQHRPHLHQRRQGAGAGHARDRPHRLHGRLGAYPHRQRQPHHPQRHLPDRELPDGTVYVDREAINAIYREASEGEASGLLKYSEEQNVSADMLGEDAAVVIEAVETHTRTGFVDLQPQPGVRRTGSP